MALLRELDITYRFKKIDCDITEAYLGKPDKVAEIFKFLQRETKEQFIVVNLSQQHTILNYEVVAIGSANNIVIRPAEVFRGAILLNAPAILLVHNHPSGDPTLSAADIAFTQQLTLVAKQLQIAIVDHVVIGFNQFTSIRQTHPELFND